MKPGRILSILVVLVLVMGGVNICYSERSYEMPPTYFTQDFVPVISDDAMVECIKVYNEATWLKEKLASLTVNQYSRDEVDAYNTKVSEVNRMTSWYNSQCAGKQSYSACKAANEINRKNHRKEIPCDTTSQWRSFR